MNAPVATREMHIGFSLYWVRLVREGDEWSATWTQNDQTQSVRARVRSADEAMIEVRLWARRLEMPSAPATEPTLPQSSEEA